MANRFLSNIRINDAYTFPATDGTTGQVITTDGSGNLSFSDVTFADGARSNFVYYDVKNSSGSTINKGTAVMAVGTDGNSGHVLIAPMVCDGSVEPRYFMGVLETTLLNGDIGKVVHFGQISQLNTTAFADGDILWCDPANAGGFTVTEPLGPNLKIAAAIVISSATNGKIKVRVQGNAGLHELHDVRTISQSDGQLLVWDNTLGVWKNNGTATIDYTNGRVGIGTVTPSDKLHIRDASGGVIRLDRNDTSGSAGEVLGKIDFWGNDFSGTGYDSRGFIQVAYEDVFARAYMSLGVGPYNQTSTEAIRITSIGSVGIATTSPTEKLEVAGNVILDASNANLKIKSGITGTKGDIQWTFNTDSTVYASAGITYDNRATDGFLIDSGYPITLDYATSYIRFSNNGSEKMRLNTSGNLGIGITSPTVKLHLRETSAASAIFLDSTATTDQQNRIASLRSSGGAYSSLLIDANAHIFRTGTTERMRIDSAGNVGIGTTSPRTPLDVTGNGISFGYSSADAAERDWLISTNYSAYGDFHIRQSNAKDGNPYSAGTTRFMINASGSVGIGTNTPNRSLSVIGQLSIDNNVVGSATAGMLFSADTASNKIYSRTENNVSSALPFEIISGSSSSLYISTIGNVGIGTTSPSGKLHLVGNTADQLYLERTGAVTGKYRLGIAGSTNRFYIRDEAQSQDRIVISEDGNLGIGTTSPADKLEVVGNIRLRQSLLNAETVYISTTPRGGGTNDADMRFGNSNNGDVVTIHNGNVGIGTTSPEQNLHIFKGESSGAAANTDSSLVLENNSNTYIQFLTPTSNESGILFGDTDNDAGAITYSHSTNALSFRANAGARMTINSSGDVGIGTTSPSRKLSVAGSIEAGGKTTYTKSYASVDTTGVVVAALTTSSNGTSGVFIFTCSGGDGYQRIVYSCKNAGGTWITSKDIDEGVNALDVVASANGATVTFTFKGRSVNQSYSPRVCVEHIGAALNTTYL